MAEDYKRAQADAAALQDALAARRASVAIPIVPIKPPMATHTLHSQTQVQARQQAYLPASHPRVTQQAAQNMQQPRLTPTLAQHSMMQRTGPAASSRAYTPILAPATQSSVTHSGQNRIPVPTPASTAAAAAGPAHLSKSQSSSTSTSTAPAIAPYRQPTMQDLPLIKPPPRPRTSSIGTAMTPGGSFETQIQPKEEPQYALSRGAIRDERYRERLAAGSAANSISRGDAGMGASRLHGHSRTNSGGFVPVDGRERDSAFTSRSYAQESSAPPPKAPGGLMISLDSPLLSPRTRARIIAATTGMSVPPARTDASRPQVSTQAQRATPPPLPGLPPRSQADMEIYAQFRAQQHGKRPSHPVISPLPKQPQQYVQQNHRFPTLTQGPTKRRASLSDDLARLQHRVVSQEPREISNGPLRQAAVRHSPQQGIRLAPYAPRPAPTSVPMQRSGKAVTDHMTNAAIIATAAAAAIRTHGVRSPAAASFAQGNGTQARPVSRGAVPPAIAPSARSDASPLQDQPGYAEWRAEQDAALAAAQAAYEAELSHERERFKVEERKRERIRQLERMKRYQAQDRASDDDDAVRAVEKYRKERWEPSAERRYLTAGASQNIGAIASGQAEPDDRQVPVVKPTTSEEEKRRRRKIQYQVFVHARATQCKWHGCQAILTSWSNLEKHIKQAHIRSWGTEEKQEVDVKPDILHGSPCAVPAGHASNGHRCGWTGCTKRYDDKDRLYRHCLVEHMGDFCARCPFQCRYEGPDFGSLMAHIERRHPHCTPADFTPAVSRASPPRKLEALEPLPAVARIEPESPVEGEGETDLSATKRIGATPLVRPASPETDSRVERFVQRGISSRCPPESYDVDSSRDKGWMDRRVAGRVIGEIVKAARAQAANVEDESGDKGDREGSAESDAPKIVIDDEDGKSEVSHASFTPDSLKTLAKDIRKRIRSEMGSTPPVFNRALSPYVSPRPAPAYLSPGPTPRPAKRNLLDVGDTETGPSAKRATDKSDRYISPEDEVRIPARLPRINIRLGPGTRNESRSTSEPTLSPTVRHLPLPPAALGTSVSPALSARALPSPRSVSRGPAEVESFKALFANVKVAPQVMDDCTPSPEPMPSSDQMPDRAMSQPSHPAVPRRGLLELPAPAVPRPRSVSDMPLETRRKSMDAVSLGTADDSPLLAHVAKLLSSGTDRKQSSQLLRPTQNAQPTIGTFWRDSQGNDRTASPKRRPSVESADLQLERRLDKSVGRGMAFRRLFKVSDSGVSDTTDGQYGIGKRQSRVSYAESDDEDPWASEHEEEEGMQEGAV